MKVLFYSIREFEKPFLSAANTKNIECGFTELALGEKTAAMAKGYDAICIFTGDDASEHVIEQLHAIRVKHIAIRAAGHDNVNIGAARAREIKVVNVPEYSPYAIAEHAVAMMLALNRRLITANEQVKRLDFTVGNLLGFDMNKKTVGLIGTGKTGQIVARILNGFGCRLLAYDIDPAEGLEKELNLTYTDLETLYRESDIVSLHVPLNNGTRYLINQHAISQMKPGVMLINTARGAVVKTDAVIEGLTNGKIGFFGMDVYEKEKGVFFFDYTGKELNDPVLKKLLTMPNVLVTPHQAFATHEALTNISDATFHSFSCWENNIPAQFELTH